jgi:poly(A) polymerase
MENIIREIALEFNRHGFQLYEVGGHVRDKLLGRKFDDIDMTTDALPEISKAILEQFGSVYTVGMGFGTVGCALVGLKIEVTTFRKEVYPTNSRKPNVDFGTELIEDLRRRDFTINAIAEDPLTFRIYDPFNGRKDLQNKIIRCVGSDDRLDEDPLRMLRAIRFACQLGFNVHVRIKHPERLTIISKERINAELSKILLSPDPVRGIRLLCNTGLMLYVMPEFLNLKHLQQGKNHMKDAFEHTLAVLQKGTDYDFGDDNIVFRLTCLLHDIGKPEAYTNDGKVIHFYGHPEIGSAIAARMLRDLKYDSDTIERVYNLVLRHMEVVHDVQMTKHAVAALIRRVSSGTHNDIKMLLALGSCDMTSSLKPRYQLIADLRVLVEEVQTVLPAKQVPLDGDAIMAATGLQPSKMVGEIKDYLCDLVVDGTVALDNKDELIRLAKEYYDSRR